MTLPRVLICGTAFNRSHGGGITLSNLFQGWDKDKIAVTATGHVMYNVTTDVCDNYYLLGNKEFKWRFPLNLLQRSFPSGVLATKEGSKSLLIPDKSGMRYAIVNQFFYPALEWLGFFHCAIKIGLSDNFKNWLFEFNPEIIYLQVSTRETVLFASDLIDFLKIPSVIHIMDDWPSTISSKGPLKRYWSRKIDSEFKALLNKVDLHLSISDAMSSEYRKRYNKEFKAFHNPIDLTIWKPYSKKDFAFSGSHIKILYSGRIGPGITNSLMEAAAAIDRLALEDCRIMLYIQSAFVDPEIKKLLLKHKCVVFNSTVAYSELPSIFSDADILLIANDFDEKGKAFLKYSMPTKASEYMISGTPILVYAPQETAVSRFCHDNECAMCVNDHSEDALAQAITHLIQNEAYRKELSRKAVKLATELFDAGFVREKLYNAMIRLTESEKSRGVG